MANKRLYQKIRNAWYYPVLLILMAAKCEISPPANPPKFDTIKATWTEIVPGDSIPWVNVVDDKDSVIISGWVGDWNVNSLTHWTGSGFFEAYFECTQLRIVFESHNLTGDVFVKYGQYTDTINTYSVNPVTQLDTLIWESKELPYGRHLVTIMPIQKNVAIKRFELMYTFPFYRKNTTMVIYRDTCSLLN